MPWTFAHPAAVLPLRRLCPRWLSLPGLLLGTLLPDLGYYIGRLDLSAFCHTIPGLILGCVPLGLLLLALVMRFHRPLTVLLPAPHRGIFRGQLVPPARPAAAQLVVTAASLLIGAASHVLWDSFTHAERWGIALVPWLNEPAFVVGGRLFRVFNLLQHLSTAVGLAAMAFVYRRALLAVPRRTASPDEARRTRLILAGLVASVAIGAGTALALLVAGAPSPFSQLVVRSVVWSSSSFAVLFVLGSLAWWQRSGDA